MTRTFVRSDVVIVGGGLVSVVLAGLAHSLGWGAVAPFVFSAVAVSGVRDDRGVVLVGLMREPRGSSSSDRALGCTIRRRTAARRARRAGAQPLKRGKALRPA